MTNSRNVISVCSGLPSRFRAIRVLRGFPVVVGTASPKLLHLRAGQTAVYNRGFAMPQDRDA